MRSHEEVKCTSAAAAAATTTAALNFVKYFRNSFPVEPGS